RLREFIASGEVSSEVCTADDVPPQFVFCRRRRRSSIPLLRAFVAVPHSSK
ncbi:hypothetical protein S245_043734, partial [Arachis hypogaea]